MVRPERRDTHVRAHARRLPTGRLTPVRHHSRSTPESRAAVARIRQDLADRGVQGYGATPRGALANRNTLSRELEGKRWEDLDGTISGSTIVDDEGGLIIGGKSRTGLRRAFVKTEDGNIYVVTEAPNRPEREGRHDPKGWSVHLLGKAADHEEFLRTSYGADGGGYYRFTRRSYGSRDVTPLRTRISAEEYREAVK